MTAYIRRADWGARAPDSVSHNITPTSITAHWEGKGSFSTSGLDHGLCSQAVRSIQNYHMDTKGWVDIAYTGLVCLHDYFFEGRGSGVRTAANGSTAGNQNSYAICALLGMGDPLTQEIKNAMMFGVTLLGQPLTKVHSDWKPTACPGPELTAWVKGGVTPPTPQPEPPPQPTPTVPPFPFPAGHWMGVKSSDPRNHSGYYAADRPGVAQYQARMIERGWDLSPYYADGKFGSKTREKTIKYQTEAGLKPDGLAGEKTWHSVYTRPIT